MTVSSPKSAVKGIKLERLDERKYFRWLFDPATSGNKKLRRDSQHTRNGLTVAAAGVWSLSLTVCLCFILLSGGADVKVQMRMCSAVS